MVFWRLGVQVSRGKYNRRMHDAHVGAMELYDAGSEQWLIAAEKHFGGLQIGVKRKKVSDVDPRSAEQIALGGMTGGDRMLWLGYAEGYTRYLAPFIRNRFDTYVLVEVGILKGTGLAIWSTLFPNAQVIGLDIDVDYTKGNLAFLQRQGAFAAREPELHVFDQFRDGRERVDEILNGRQIDICIDDGFHSIEAALATVQAVKSSLAEFFVYFIEDNYQVAPQLRAMLPEWNVQALGPLTVMTRK
jgi:hypothetical protein